jgi:hypothetical protein
MFKKAIQICLLLEGMQQKIDAAKADGEVSMEEKKALVVAFLAGVVDIATSFLPVEAVEAALEDIEAIRERVKLYRAKSADVLDELSASADEVLS